MGPHSELVKVGFAIDHGTMLAKLSNDSGIIRTVEVLQHVGAGRGRQVRCADVIFYANELSIKLT